MARPAATYRGARRNLARATRKPMMKYTVVVVGYNEDTGMKRIEVRPLPEPRYVPYVSRGKVYR